MTGNKKLPNLDVAVQEDFGVTGRTTLEKLDTYIRHCDAVIHLIGKATGAVAEEPAVAALLATYPDFGTRLTPLAAHRGGDILKRDTVRLAEADREYQNDATRPYGHAFKAMEAYEK